MCSQSSAGTEVRRKFLQSLTLQRKVLLQKHHQWDIYEHENNLIKITRAQETLEHSFLFAEV